MIDSVREVLAKAGFYLSEKHDERGISFDIIARRDNILLIINVMVNADSSRSENSREMQILANALKGSALFVSFKGGQRPLERGVIYSRKGIPVVSLETMEDLFLEGIPPYVFSAPGGFFVSIDSDILKKARNEKHISLGTLAEIAGVSRKAIQKYEDGMGVDLDVALRIEEFLGEDLIMPLNPLEYSKEEVENLENLDLTDDFQRAVFQTLLNVGYDIVPTHRCPFEAITSDDDVVLLSGVHSRVTDDLQNKAKIVSNLSSVTEKRSVIFLDKIYTRTSIQGTPLIARRELLFMESKSDILELLKERSKGE